MIQPKIVIFSAPSGAGKTTIVRHLVKNKNFGLEFSISATNRPPRRNEKEGVDYYFLDTHTFKEKIIRGEFLEWEEVYDNQFYGTLKSEVERIWGRRKHIIFDIDVIGGLNIKKIYGDRALAVFIKPPSIEALNDRISKRSSENKGSLKKRLEKAAYEISFAEKFDYILLNDSLEKALKGAEQVVSNFLYDKTSNL